MEKKQDHRGRRRELRKGEKGEWERREGGGGSTEFRFDCHFQQRERQKKREKTEWCKDLLSGFYGNSRLLSSTVIYYEGI